MTEQEWLACTDPAAMLATLRAPTTPGPVGFTVPGQVGGLAYYASDRKLRLFADALLDAGCEDEDLLRYCRGEERCPKCGGKGEFDPYPNETRNPSSRPIECRFCTGGWVPLSNSHVRGCWAIDLILGRN